MAKRVSRWAGRRTGPGGGEAVVSPVTNPPRLTTGAGGAPAATTQSPDTLQRVPAPSPHTQAWALLLVSGCRSGTPQGLGVGAPDPPGRGSRLEFNHSGGWGGKGSPERGVGTEAPSQLRRRQRFQPTLPQTPRHPGPTSARSSLCLRRPQLQGPPAPPTVLRANLPAQRPFLHPTPRTETPLGVLGGCGFAETETGGCASPRVTRARPADTRPASARPQPPRKTASLEPTARRGPQRGGGGWQPAGPSSRGGRAERRGRPAGSGKRDPGPGLLSLPRRRVLPGPARLRTQNPGLLGFASEQRRSPGRARGSTRVKESPRRPPRVGRGRGVVAQRSARRSQGRPDLHGAGAGGRAGAALGLMHRCPPAARRPHRSGSRCGPRR